MSVLKIIILILIISPRVGAYGRLKVEESQIKEIIDDVKSKWNARGVLLSNALTKVQSNNPHLRLLYANVLSNDSPRNIHSY